MGPTSFLALPVSRGPLAVWSGRNDRSRSVLALHHQTHPSFTACCGQHPSSRLELAVPNSSYRVSVLKITSTCWCRRVKSCVSSCLDLPFTSINIISDIHCFNQIFNQFKSDRLRLTQSQGVALHPTIYPSWRQGPLQLSAGRCFMVTTAILTTHNSTDESSALIIGKDADQVAGPQVRQRDI